MRTPNLTPIGMMYRTPYTPAQLAALNAIHGRLERRCNRIAVLVTRGRLTVTQARALQKQALRHAESKREAAISNPPPIRMSIAEIDRLETEMRVEKFGRAA